MTFNFEVNNLVELLAALLTPIVAIFGIYIARQQYLLNRKNMAKDDYSKIVKIITSIDGLKIGRNGNYHLNTEKVRLLIELSYELKMLIGKNPEIIMLDLADDLINIRGIDYKEKKYKELENRININHSKLIHILDNELDEIKMRTKK